MKRKVLLQYHLLLRKFSILWNKTRFPLPFPLQTLNVLFLFHNLMNSRVFFGFRFLPCEPRPIHEKPSRSDDKSIESESDSDSDEDSDEDLAPLDRPAKPPTIGKVRRNSVCAEELNVKTFMQSSDVKNIPKSDEEAERIRHILKKNMLFQHLDEEQLLTVQNAMFLVEKENGDVIIQQGDDGDNFYILDQGRVNVFLEPKDTSSLEVEQNPDELSSTTPENETDDSKQDENYCTAEGDNTMEKEQDKGKKPVCTYEDGDFFGELAIMYNAPRAATCIADGPVKLWALDRVSFKVILMQTTIEKRNTHKEFLKKVPLLSELTEYELLTFADSLQEEIFKDGETICKEGNNGEKFYIIKEGTAICLKTNSTSGEEYEVATLSNGSYFGEVRNEKARIF